MKNEELIQKLEEHKKRTGKTNRELSEAIGVTVETISRWFNEHHIPDSRPILQAIKKVLAEENKE